MTTTGCFAARHGVAVLPSSMTQEDKSAYRGCSGCPSYDETLDTAQRRVRDEAGHTSARVRGLPWYQHASLRSP